MFLRTEGNKKKKKNYFLVVKRIFLFFLFKIIFENNYQIDPNFLFFLFYFSTFPMSIRHLTLNLKTFPI